MTMAILPFAVLVVSAFHTTAVVGQELVTYAVPCDYLTPNCECPLRYNGDIIDVCEFQLEISTLQTFTRYLVNNTISKSSPKGELWIINETGELIPHSPPDTTMLHCADLNNDNCTEPYTVDGFTYKTIISINRRLPGPTLIVNQGQVLSINVTNSLDSEVVSIHWHGLDQRNTNFMDGVEHVTQCGASPGASFRYIFEAAQSGTYWYHSHTGVQRTDGLFGALVIKENEELINKTKLEVGEFQDQPDNHTLIFIDWQLKSSLELFTLLEAGTPFYDNFEVPSTSQRAPERYPSQDGAGVDPISFWSGLVNGRGRYYEVDYVQSLLSIFTVSPNTTYRFRLIGAQGLFAFRFSIDGHKLKVFAMDGTLIEPREVDFIIFHSGERYDFLLETKSSAEVDDNSDFAIRGETLENNPSPPEPHVAEAILHYDVDSEPSSTEYADIFNQSLRVRETCTEANRCSALNCPFKLYPSTFYIDCIPVSDMKLLFPLDNSELPDVDVDDEDQVFLNFAFEGSGRSASINARTHVLPSSPLALLSNDEYEVIQDKEFCTGTSTNSTCNNNPDRKLLLNPECICTHVQTLRFNKSIQMVLSSTNPSYEASAVPIFRASHPIHLHGHQFHVVDIQYGEYDDAGVLTRANDSIVCGGTNACTNPRWRPGRDYSIGRTGKISNTAPLKDTIFLPAGGHVVLYFKSDNPGFWYLHCHIEVHQLEGMAMIIAEAPEERLAAPSEMDRCGDFTWSLEDFYGYLQGNPPEELPSDEDDDDGDEDLYMRLSIGLGVGLLVLLIVNVIQFLVCCCCCVIKRDPQNLKGA